MTRVSSARDVTWCSRQLYSHRRRRKDHTAGESRPPLPSTAHISSVARSRTVWLFTTGPPALPLVSLCRTKLVLGGGPALAAGQLQPPLAWSHHCWFSPSKEASYTTGNGLRICSWRLRKQLVSNRNSLSLIRFNKNLRLATPPWHCHGRSHL